MQRVAILGSTGSIGVSTLDVISRHPQRFEVFALTAHTRIQELACQCLEFNPRYAVVPTTEAAVDLRARVGGHTQVLCGDEGLLTVAAHPDVDTVMAAIVGAAGLPSALAAARAGKRLLLANKEALVMAGGVFMAAVAESGATLLPIDSEHNAIFQCLPAGYGNPANAGVRRLLLSASGGPFRTVPLADLGSVTPDQACAHPNWRMGRKISVDSATMMNKGLELIEACWLFDVSPQVVDIVIHPQSIVHSLVEYCDGSVLAQLGNPDMRTPIAHALGWPERLESGVSSLDLVKVASLHFEAPDPTRFPSLALARAACELGGDAPTALNAANEEAVAAFLTGGIRFTHIIEIVDAVMQRWQCNEPLDLHAVQAADADARRLARRLLSRDSE